MISATFSYISMTLRRHRDGMSLEMLAATLHTTVGTCPHSHPHMLYNKHPFPFNNRRTSLQHIYTAKVPPASQFPLHRSQCPIFYSAKAFVASFLYSSTPRFLYSSIPRFLDSSIPRFLDSSIPLFLYLSVHLFLYSFIHLFTYSSIHIFRITNLYHSLILDARFLSLFRRTPFLAS